MNRSFRFNRQAGLVLGLLTFVAPGFAADRALTQGCREDMRKLCHAVKPGGGRALACLQAHESELSANCQAALPTLKRCAQEMNALCGDASALEARSCLRKNADKLPAECRSAGRGR